MIAALENKYLCDLRPCRLLLSLCDSSFMSRVAGDFVVFYIVYSVVSCLSAGLSGRISSVCEDTDFLAIDFWLFCGHCLERGFLFLLVSGKCSVISFLRSMGLPYNFLYELL